MSSSINWDEQAQHYSSNVTRFTSLHASDLIGALYNDIKSARTILDIGCGPGAFGVAYLNSFPQGIDGQTLILSDLSPVMVDKARNVMESLVPPTFKTKLEYKVEDGALLEGIETDSIDVVVSIFGVFLIPDRIKTLKTIQRVLTKPNGVFGTAVWTSLECSDSLRKEGFGAGFHNSMDQSLGGLTNMFSDKEAPWKQWVDRDNIQRMVVDEGGFASVRIHRAIHSIPWPSAFDFWKMIAISVKADEADPAVVEDAKTKLIETVNNGDETSPVFLWFASNLVVARGASFDQLEN